MSIASTAATTAAAAAACVDPVSNYHTAFPALQSIPWPSSLLQQYQVANKKRHSIPSSTIQHSLSPPKPPAYLKHTQYATLVREQYHYLLQKRYENTKKLSNDTHTLSSQHQLLLQSEQQQQQQQQQSNLVLAELDLRLPSFWNSADKSRYLEIDKNGLGVKYVGPGRSEDHAGTVRANLPMRNQCGVYYFEMHVKSKGDDGYIGIGFCSARNELKRLPGWDKLSFGYHGDDGHSFEGSGIGKKYGPQFKTGDVIGCGVNFANKTAFYTKNGTFLGIAFKDLDLSLPMYPCVGMRTAGEYITVNFGQDSFMYDIVQYIQEHKLSLWKDIGNYPVSIDKTKPASSTVNQLILSYMIHHGYSRSAKALVKDSAYLAESTSSSSSSLNHPTNDLVMDTGDDDLHQRLEAKNAVLQGDIDQAIQILTMRFPAILQNQGSGSHILFQLKCQKFVEMVGEYDNKDTQRRRSSLTSSHQRRYSEVDSMISLSSDDDHMSTLSSSQSSTHDYFDHHHGGSGNDMENDRHHHHHQHFHPLATATKIGKDDGKSQKWTTNDNQQTSSTSSRSRSISAHAYHGYSPPITTDSSAPGRRMSWAAIVAAPASPNHTDTMDLGDSFDRNYSAPKRHSLRRNSNSSSSNGYSSCSSLSGILGSDRVLAEQDESQSSDDMDTDDGMIKFSLHDMMQSIMTFGQELQDEYGKNPSPTVKDKLKQIFSLLAYPDPRSSPMSHLLEKETRETLASEVNVAILVHQNRPEIPPLDCVYRQILTVNKELTYLGHGDSVMLDITQDHTHSIEHDTGAL
ncbi:hypothetical protein BC941DRAFT_411329 [Chlamydoabsidia padenii]|nr:hypothetical protein BC941DRAFT_411329 [Chlamydoabsidia padenii]